MPFEFIQIPANGQGSAKEELNRLLRGRRIASVRKAFVSHGEDSFWAYRLVANMTAAAQAMTFSNDRRGRLSSLTAGTAVFLLTYNLTP